VRRTLRIGAGCALALVLVTCTEQTLTGPRGTGVAALNLSALAPQANDVPVPIDSLEITLRRPADESVAADRVLPLLLDIAKGDSAVVRLNVALRSSPEDFLLSVRAFGRGITWYTGSSPIRMSAGIAATPLSLVVQYVGPGADAARLALAPSDTTVVGGVPFPLRALVFDSSQNAITGVPVGYRLSDATKASVTYPTPFTATFTGKATVRDSVWVIAETPTHLTDSTRVHIVPPAAALQKNAGDLQTSVVGAALPAPLVVRVLDGLGGGFKGDTVRWSIATGSATLAAAFSVSDDSGYASMIVTPTTVGAFTVRAAIAGLAGSPVTFSETVIAGTISSVTISPKLMTIANGDSLPYTAAALDGNGLPVSTTFGWTSTAPAVASVGGTGVATARAGDSTMIIASAGGVADTAVLYVRALKAIVLSPADTIVTAVGDFVDLQASPVYNFTVVGGSASRQPSVAAKRSVVTIPGENIRFSSASPSVATVDRLTGRAIIIGPGDAVIFASDSVASSDSLIHGVAIVHVNQATAGIFNSPKSPVTVGVLGQAQLTATAFDANGYPIPGKAFAWLALPDKITGGLIADVTSTGLVTGVTVGTTYVFASLIEGQSVFTDSTEVVVSDNAPSLLQWAVDSITVDKGGTTLVSLSVTTPAPGPVTIELKSSDDGIAQATPNSVTIPPGLSTTSVKIAGVEPGRAVLTAHDAGGSGKSYPDALLTVDVVSTDMPSLMLNRDFSVSLGKPVQTFVYIPFPAPADITVTLSVAPPLFVDVPKTVTIQKGSSIAYFDVTGLLPVLGTLSASAPGFLDAASVSILVQTLGL
jgi:Bacterial Ig-like domain (group 1)